MQNDKDCNSVRKLLPKLIHHLDSHKSALSGLLGLYKIQKKGLGASQFLVMRDVMPAAAERCSRSFDLKGSIIGRHGTAMTSVRKAGLYVPEE